MSPELFSNKPYDYKTDIWSLGCCVYEMAALRQAFTAKNFNSLVYQVVRGQVPPIPDCYSTDLTKLITSMLSADPASRPSVR